MEHRHGLHAISTFLTVLTMVLPIPGRTQQEALQKTDLDLIVAIKSGDDQKVLKALAEGANGEARDPEGPEPHPLAVGEDEMGHLPALLLLYNQAYISARLHFDWSHGPDLTLVKALLDHGAKVNDQGNTGLTPLNYAARFFDSDAVRLLLARGADPNLADSCGHPPLLGANAAITRLLLEHGAKVNAVGKDKKTALMWAAEDPLSDGRLDVVQILLAHGAQVNAVDSAGRTALMWASDRDLTEVVRVLLKHGAKVNVLDITHSTALISAALYGRTDVVRLLLNHGAIVNLVDDNDQSALTNAAEWGSADTVRLLLNHGASVNTLGRNKQTALIMAAVQNHSEVVRILLEHGAKVGIKDAHGLTALDWARQRLWEQGPNDRPNPQADSDEIIALLGKYGAK